MKKLATIALLGALGIPAGLAASPQHKAVPSQEQTETGKKQDTKKKKKSARKRHDKKTEAKKG